MAAVFSLSGSSLPTRWKITEDGLGQREVEGRSCPAQTNFPYLKSALKIVNLAWEKRT